MPSSNCDEYDEFAPAASIFLTSIITSKARQAACAAAVDLLPAPPAKGGADPRQSAMTTHRIDPAVVRRDFAKAGFALDAESDVLRNPDDDHARSVFDPEVRGRTDRFLMRFRRPR